MSLQLHQKQSRIWHTTNISIIKKGVMSKHLLLAFKKPPTNGFKDIIVVSIP